MITILKYVLLGILLYVVVIPIVEELATVIIQGLEVIKGKFILIISDLQDKAEQQVKKKTERTSVIGFIQPDNEEDFDDDDEST